MAKTLTIFDHLANLTHKKVPWSELSELDQKSFAPYLINRWLSMNPDYIELVDMLQQYTIGLLDKKHVYQLYYELLPKQKTFSKYIKGKKVNKYQPELVKFICDRFWVNKQEAADYIELLPRDVLISELKRYGNDDANIKRLLNSPK
jgi:hypothetical protein